MNIKNVLENIFAWGITTAICTIYRYIKAEEGNLNPPKEPSPAKTLQKQFFAALFTLVVSLPAAFMFPISRQPTPTGMVRIFLFIIAGFAFLFVWGAFDAAFAFYPKDDRRDDEPSEQAAGDTTQD